LPPSYSRDRNYLRKLRDATIAEEIQQLEEYYNWQFLNLAVKKEATEIKEKQLRFGPENQ
jgi:hypothetical protein